MRPGVSGAYWMRERAVGAAAALSSMATSVSRTRWPVTTTIGNVTESAAAMRLPITVTGGSEVTAARAATCRGATHSEPTAVVPAARTAERQDGGEDVLGHGGLLVDGRIGDALDVNVGSAAAPSQRLATKRAFGATGRR